MNTMSPTGPIKRKNRPTPPLKLFASTAAGLEEMLTLELRRIGAQDIVPAQRGASFRGDLAVAYRANLWLRTAHRVLLEVGQFEAPERNALYEGARAVRWSEHMGVDNTLAVDAVSHHSAMNHTQFISRVVKDAVVDQFRDRLGRRPSVDTRNPDLKINARLQGDRCTLSVDLSGERLHRRGYRPSFGTPAPLKETLAAGIVMLSGYDGTEPFVDPMCGSGTLLIEAALIAKGIAPGLLGRSFGFFNHPSFDKRMWKDHVEEAKERVQKDVEVPVIGSDVSEAALRAASVSAQGAGVDDIVRLRRVEIKDVPSRHEGMVVTNPPYGERLGELDKLSGLYRDLGDALKHKCSGMTAHVLTSSKFLAGKIGLHAHKRDCVWNGPLECRLLHFKMY